MDESKKDFLTEVINIGMGRASAVLSEMVNAKVFLTIPELNHCKIEQLSENLKLPGKDKFTIISQSFNGLLTGSANLMLNKYSGEILAKRVVDNLKDIDEFATDKEEVLKEVGNIVINNMIGSWSTIFYDQFTFGVPEYHVCSVPELIYEHRAKNTKMEIKQAIFADAHFELKDMFMVGTLFILFDDYSLKKLLGSFEESEAVD